MEQLKNPLADGNVLFIFPQADPTATTRPETNFPPYPLTKTDVASILRVDTRTLDRMRSVGSFLCGRLDHRAVRSLESLDPRTMDRRGVNRPRGAVGRVS